MAIKPRTSIIDGFSRATTDAYSKNRIIGLSYGEVGSRKTSFWLEAPGPIAVFSLDQGLEGVIPAVLENEPDKEIQVWEREWFPDPTTDMQERAIQLRDEFQEKYEAAITGGHFRTVVLDKATDWWELYRYAEFGAPNESPRNYPELNQRFRKVVNMAKATNLNVGFIEGMKDEWVSKINKKTGAQGAAASGNRIRAGFSELDGLVHMVLLHAGTGPDDWSITCGKVRGPGAMSVAGQTFTFSEVGSFRDFATLVFPSTELEDWA